MNADRPIGARCKCGGLLTSHNENNRMCYHSPVCGCTQFRPDNGQRWQPAREPDDNLEPRRRVDMGAHRVESWPERGDV
jgi:hypothetical protein